MGSSAQRWSRIPSSLRSPRIHFTTSSTTQHTLEHSFILITCLWYYFFFLLSFSMLHLSFIESHTFALSSVSSLFPLSSLSFLYVLGHVCTGSCHSFIYKSHSLETKETKTYTFTNTHIHIWTDIRRHRNNIQIWTNCSERCNVQVNMHYWSPINVTEK